MKPSLIRAPLSTLSTLWKRVLIKPFGQCCITFQFPGSITSFLTFILRCHESSESATAHAPSVEHSGQIFSKPPRILMRSQWPLFSMFSSCHTLGSQIFWLWGLPELGLEQPISHCQRLGPDDEKNIRTFQVKDAVFWLFFVQGSPNQLIGEAFSTRS